MSTYIHQVPSATGCGFFPRSDYLFLDNLALVLARNLFVFLRQATVVGTRVCPFEFPRAPAQ